MKKKRVPYWDNGTTLFDFFKRGKVEVKLIKKKPEVRLIPKKPEN